MRSSLVILLLIAAFVTQCIAADSLRVGSFNIQVFGTKTMSKPHVVTLLTKILSRYHIVFIQEIRDHTNTALEELVKTTNENQGTNFEYVVSERLGRSASKEQYAYIYDPTRLTVLSTYQFPDENDWFERPPYSIAIESKHNGRKLFLTGIHVKPRDAVAEIDHLVDVYDFYIGSNNINQGWICMGDFNAGGSYVAESDMESIRLRQMSDRFEWLIKDGTRTTVSEHNYAYDRFVVDTMVSGTADVFRFDLSMRISIEEAREVSDHFPIEMVVKDF
ncbi:deoxyribonuclease [Acrasis kona]|uniref:Deoxyribonuclease n=1 Tax=Acrasis kona TaxID=1008807 RepID=A0AAW2YT60_9EUKA